jgi:hypothetical protein
MADLNGTINALRSEIAAQQVGVLVLVECSTTCPGGVLLLLLLLLLAVLVA